MAGEAGYFSYQYYCLFPLLLLLEVPLLEITHEVRIKTHFSISTHYNWKSLDMWKFSHRSFILSFTEKEMTIACHPMSMEVRSTTERGEDL